jgi:hypothetical protein
MPICPQCHDEYDDGVTACAECRVPLLPDGAPLPPRVDRLLGVFHPVMATSVTALLARRAIAHEVLSVDDGRVEVVVDRDFRDDLRAELAVNWTELVQHTDPDLLVEVLRVGAPQPGWYDAPASAWVDRNGRLQVDRGEDDESLAEAGRQWGPTLVVVGAVVGLFGWYGQDSGGLLVLGLGLAGLGLFLPR